MLRMTARLYECGAQGSNDVLPEEFCFELPVRAVSASALTVTAAKERPRPGRPSGVAMNALNVLHKTIYRYREPV